MPSTPTTPVQFALTSFEDLLQSELASEGGVTKLNCGHIFCRKDLLEWFGTLHGSCPTCRYVVLDDIKPPGSDDESSDGGEYNPSDDDEDEEDAFMDTSDGFDTDFDMELGSDDVWERSDGDEMQISAELSEPSSEGDDQAEGETVEVNVSVGEEDQESLDDSSDEIQADREPK
ncbi:hypothetical protein DFH09DRAFT_1271751 [Mycena vulgaris]|nr:hypothetical protein DFH09DRAFT_1271751 [Mycena vulgaris]